MAAKSLALIPLLLAGVAGAQTTGSNIPRTPDGHPDFQGIWTNATLTPLERPSGLAATLSDAEALPLEKRAVEAIDTERRGRDQEQDRSCAGDNAAPDCGWSFARVDGRKRSSLILDPPDGRIPPFRPEARAAAEKRMQPPTRFDSIQDRPLPERCLLGFGPSAGPPMMPGFYNNNYQIVQTPEAVMILAEMMHDVRIIRLGGVHLPPTVRLWFGDSVGHWEGDALVVDTTNFTEKTPFHGTSRELHVVERFTRSGPGSFLYRVTLDDPATFTRAWTMEYPFVVTPGPVYEYSCHEGNALVIGDILGGAP